MSPPTPQKSICENLCKLVAKNSPPTNPWQRTHTNPWGEDSVGGEGRKKSRLGAWRLPSGCLFGLK